MKKFFLLFSFGFILLSTSLVSCDDDNNGNNGFELTSYLDGEYSKTMQTKPLLPPLTGTECQSKPKSISVQEISKREASRSSMFLKAIIQLK